MQQHRLDALDGLRGIAIGLVLWYHLWQISWLDPHLIVGSYYFGFVYFPVSGFLGVELFFFISAFCLSYPYVRARFAGRPLPAARHFAYRRFIKIVPSYVLSIVLVIAFAAVPGAKESWGANINWRGAGAALFDLGAHLAFLHTYFFDTYASINGVLWTLGIEVQFYVVFPLLVLALLRFPLALAAVMTALAVGYRLWIGQCCRLPVFDHNIDQVLGFLDYFAAGMLCAFVYEWLRLRRPALAGARWLWLLVAVGGFTWMVLLFANLEHLRREEHFAEWWVIRNGTFYATAIFAAALGSLLTFPAWRRVLANRVLVFLSVISYNLYLWHQVTLRWVATWPFTHKTWVTRGDPAWEWITTICGLALSIGMASLVTYAFERPLLRMDPQTLRMRLRGLFGRAEPAVAPSTESQ